MGKAYIFNDHLNTADRSTIETVVKAAGYDPIYGVLADISSLDPETNVGVVGLPASAEDVAAINERTKAFAGVGIRIIAIWLREEETGGVDVPDSIGKYGIAVDIGSAELPEVLKGEKDVWEEPGGKPRPKPVTRRNKC